MSKTASNILIAVVAAVLAAALCLGLGYGALTSGLITLPTSNSLSNVSSNKSGSGSATAKSGEAPDWQTVASDVSGSVVSIQTALSNGTAKGSGAIIDTEGHIITNNHVISGAQQIQVTLANGNMYSATLVGTDTTTDLAVIKLDNPPSDLKAVKFADSDKLAVGENVMAIGNPLGEQLRWTMTNGIISAINRDMVYNGHSMTLLQTNAAINEGNSGGPLINMYGQVIGITNMKALSTGVEGIGFAIPTASIRPIVNALLADGRVSGRVSIGITVGAVSSAASEYYDLPDGLYISAVAEGSDAEKQGIQSGDMLLAVNGQAVTTTYDVSAAKDGLKVGDTVTLTIYRDGKTFDVDVKLVDTNDIS